jgi:hypothetical protein
MAYHFKCKKDLATFTSKKKKNTWYLFSITFLPKACTFLPSKAAFKKE